MLLIITCNHGTPKKPIDGSHIKFYTKNDEEKKKLIDIWHIPIKTARLSLTLFNSPYKKVFEEKIKKIQEELKIPDDRIISFTQSKKIQEGYINFLDKMRGENMELSPEDRKKEREKRKTKEREESRKKLRDYQREYRREYRRLQKLDGKNPELANILRGRNEIKNTQDTQQGQI